MKHWYESKLIWLGNALTFGGGFLLWAHDSGNLDPLLAYLPDNIAGMATSATGVLVIVLRYMTVSGIGKNA